MYITDNDTSNSKLAKPLYRYSGGDFEFLKLSCRNYTKDNNGKLDIKKMRKDKILYICIDTLSYFYYVTINFRTFVMRKIIPVLTKNLLNQNINPQKVAQCNAILVADFNELRMYMAQLSCANKDYILFYRGQNQDYMNPRSKNSTFFPTIYRGNRLSKKLLEQRWEKLEKACDIFMRLFKSNFPKSSYILRRKKIVQWSILQHYEVTETPLIDVTQSLKVACSFAQLNNTGDFSYVYAFALPYYTNRISVNSEHYLTNVRLLSIAPPQALRPYYQEGFLVGEDEFMKNYTRKENLDLNNRLVAKFKFKNTPDFWCGESPFSEDDLYPENDDIAELCNKVKEELEKGLKSSNSE